MDLLLIFAKLKSNNIVFFKKFFRNTSTSYYTSINMKKMKKMIKLMLEKL